MSKIAVQLFTLRDFTATASDFAATAARLGAMGFTAVQVSAVAAIDGPAPELTPSAAREVLDSNGLRCIGTHRSWTSLAGDTDGEIDYHRALGTDLVAISSLPREYMAEGVGGYRRFLREAPKVLDALSAEGIRLGVHNHAHEFERTGPERRTFYDVLVDESDPRLTFEIDVFWATHAGVNPVRLFERLPGRVPVMHAKDREVVGRDGPVMAPVGEGNLDWDAIIPACKRAGVEWYAIEQDVCRRDPFDCLRSSREFLTSRGV